MRKFQSHLAHCSTCDPHTFEVGAMDDEANASGPPEVVDLCESSSPDGDVGLTDSSSSVSETSSCCSTPCMIDLTADDEPRPDLPVKAVPAVEPMPSLAAVPAPTSVPDSPGPALPAARVLPVTQTSLLGVGGVLVACDGTPAVSETYNLRAEGVAPSSEDASVEAAAAPVQPPSPSSRQGTAAALVDAPPVSPCAPAVNSALHNGRRSFECEKLEGTLFAPRLPVKSDESVGGADDSASDDDDMISNGATDGKSAKMGILDDVSLSPFHEKSIPPRSFDESRENPDEGDRAEVEARNSDARVTMTDDGTLATNGGGAHAHSLSHVEQSLPQSDPTTPPPDVRLVMLPKNNAFQRAPRVWQVTRPNGQYYMLNSVVKELGLGSAAHEASLLATLQASAEKVACRSPEINRLLEDGALSDNDMEDGCVWLIDQGGLSALTGVNASKKKTARKCVGPRRPGLHDPSRGVDASAQSLGYMDGGDSGISGMSGLMSSPLGDESSKSQKRSGDKLENEIKKKPKKHRAQAKNDDDTGAMSLGPRVRVRTVLVARSEMGAAELPGVKELLAVNNNTNNNNNNSTDATTFQLRSIARPLVDIFPHVSVLATVRDLDSKGTLRMQSSEEADLLDDDVMGFHSIPGAMIDRSDLGLMLQAPGWQNAWGVKVSVGAPTGFPAVPQQQVARVAIAGENSRALVSAMPLDDAALMQCPDGAMCDSSGLVQTIGDPPGAMSGAAGSGASARDATNVSRDLNLSLNANDGGHDGMAANVTPTPTQQKKKTREVREHTDEYNEVVRLWQDKVSAKCPGEPPITIINDVDDEPPPDNFEYIAARVESGEVQIAPVVGYAAACACTVFDAKGRLKQTCSLDSPCCDIVFGVARAYKKGGRLAVDPSLGTNDAIYECNALCHCDVTCRNRVVQRGRKVKLRMFRTDNGRGWGVQALEDIPQGSFVCEYVGEIITFEEAERRGQENDAIGVTYLFDLDFHTPKTEDCRFVLDAGAKGNISRFINHSCDPNLVSRSVWIDNRNPDLPHICLFARHTIRRFQELTYNYHIDSCGGAVTAPCLCGAAICKGTMTATFSH